VKGAAVELPRGLRINCISPTVLVESEAYYPNFAGFIPVPAWEVGRAYLRRCRRQSPGASSRCTRRTADEGGREIHLRLGLQQLYFRQNRAGVREGH
jgi:hypothetical protein